MGRVLAIGLDSADEIDLRARLDAGTMPHLAALRDRGTWCSLTVDPLCRAEHPWSTFATGRDPARRGRWTGVTFDPSCYGYRSEGAPDVPPFWAVGDEAAVVSLDVPASTLARDTPGAHVVGWAIHEPMYSRCSSPPALLADLDRRLGLNEAVPLEYAGTWHDATWLRRYGAALVASTHLRVDVIEQLLDAAPDWRLGVVVFAETHQVAHHTWHGVSSDSVLRDAPTAALGREVLDDLHDALDEAIGQLVATLEPDDVVVVFSPKGNEALCDLPSNVLVPELFHRLASGQPLLRQPPVRRSDGRPDPPLFLGGGVDYASTLRETSVDSWPRRARTAAHRTTVAVANRLAPGPMERRRQRRQGRREDESTGVPPDPAALGPLTDEDPYDSWLVATWYRRWWPTMPFFALPSFSDLHVRVNVAGRERDGIVAPADYARVCDDVEAIVRACRSGRTGHPIVGRVVRPRGNDPFADAGLPADVVVGWAEDTDVIDHPDVGAVGPFPAWRVAGHAPRGFALVAGGDIGHGTLTGPALVDLPATILDLAGLAPPHPIDGTPVVLPRVEGVTV